MEEEMEAKVCHWADIPLFAFYVCYVLLCIFSAVSPFPLFYPAVAPHYLVSQDYTTCI